MTTINPKLPYWHHRLALSWYQHQPESHQQSLTKFLYVGRELERPGPIDRTPETPGSGKKCLCKKCDKSNICSYGDLQNADLVFCWILWEGGSWRHYRWIAARWDETGPTKMPSLPCTASRAGKNVKTPKSLSFFGDTYIIVSIFLEPPLNL